MSCFGVSAVTRSVYLRVTSLFTRRTRPIRVPSQFVAMTL